MRPRLPLLRHHHHHHHHRSSLGTTTPTRRLFSSQWNRCSAKTLKTNPSEANSTNPQHSRGGGGGGGGGGCENGGKKSKAAVEQEQRKKRKNNAAAVQHSEKEPSIMERLRGRIAAMKKEDEKKRKLWDDSSGSGGNSHKSNRHVDVDVTLDNVIDVVRKRNELRLGKANRKKQDGMASVGAAASASASEETWPERRKRRRGKQAERFKSGGTTPRFNKPFYSAVYPRAERERSGGQSSGYGYENAKSNRKGIVLKYLARKAQTSENADQDNATPARHASENPLPDAGVSDKAETHEEKQETTRSEPILDRESAMLLTQENERHFHDLMKRDWSMIDPETVNMLKDMLRKMVPSAEVPVPMHGMMDKLHSLLKRIFEHHVSFHTILLHPIHKSTNVVITPSSVPANLADGQERTGEDLIIKIFVNYMVHHDIDTQDNYEHYFRVMRYYVDNAGKQFGFRSPLNTERTIIKSVVMNMLDQSEQRGEGEWPMTTIRLFLDHFDRTYYGDMRDKDASPRNHRINAVKRDSYFWADLLKRSFQSDEHWTTRSACIWNLLVRSYNIKLDEHILRELLLGLNRRGAFRLAHAIFREMETQWLSGQRGTFLNLASIASEEIPLWSLGKTPHIISMSSVRGKVVPLLIVESMIHVYLDRSSVGGPLGSQCFDEAELLFERYYKQPAMIYGRYVNRDLFETMRQVYSKHKWYSHRANDVDHLLGYCKEEFRTVVPFWEEVEHNISG